MAQCETHRQCLSPFHQNLFDIGISSVGGINVCVIYLGKCHQLEVQNLLCLWFCALSIPLLTVYCFILVIDTFFIISEGKVAFNDASVREKGKCKTHG